MFFAKINQSGKSAVLAVCDSELIGKEFRIGNEVLDLKSYGYFYKGTELKSEAELESLLKGKQFSSLNLVGEKTVKVALKMKIVRESGTRTVAGIPHAQVYYI